MQELVLFVAGSCASFFGSYVALKIHVEYLKRDVEHVRHLVADLVKEKNDAHDKIHERINRLQEQI